jgi:hypothetical protein
MEVVTACYNLYPTRVDIYILAHGLWKTRVLCEQRTINYEVNGILVESNIYYAACLENSVNFLVAQVHKINF